MFAIFDKTKSGNIDLGNLTTAMRLLGQNPTESELKLIQESILRNRNGIIYSSGKPYFSFYEFKFQMVSGYSTLVQFQSGTRKFVFIKFNNIILFVV